MKFKVGDTVFPANNPKAKAKVVRTGELAWDNRPYTVVQFFKTFYITEYYDEYLVLVKSEPVGTKEEQLLGKIKQLWERQDFVRNHLTLS